MKFDVRDYLIRKVGLSRKEIEDFQFEAIRLDNELLHIIIKFYNKGYTPLFSCSGHNERNGYVSLREDVEIPDIMKDKIVKMVYNNEAIGKFVSYVVSKKSCTLGENITILEGFSDSVEMNRNKEDRVIDKSVGIAYWIDRIDGYCNCRHIIFCLKYLNVDKRNI